MNPSARVYVAGGRTLIGAALLEHLHAEGFSRLVGTPPDEPDLTVRAQVEDFFAEARPEYVLVAAGLSGGIGLNRARPAELMLDNLLVTAHLLEAAQNNGVRRLLYLASSCAYPREAPQPLRVESLLAGPPEPTSLPYATAKLAGWQLCDAFRHQYGADFLTAIPANAFGPHDDFAADSGHVIPALIRRMHEARLRGEETLKVWGTGQPRREFIFVRDLAEACVFVLRHHPGGGPINLGSGTSLTIAEVAQTVAAVVGYRGRLVFDTTHPDGAPLKMLDSGPLFSLGWRPRTEFRAALAETYHWFLQHEVKDDERESAAVPVAVPHPPRRGRGRPGLPHR